MDTGLFILFMMTVLNLYVGIFIGTDYRQFESRFQTVKETMSDKALLLIQILIALPISLLLSWLAVRFLDWYYDKYGMP